MVINRVGYVRDCYCGEERRFKGYVGVCEVLGIGGRGLGCVCLY